MPVAQQDQWQQGSSQADDGAILRLEAALGRIAAAAGRKQDELRVAELTARAAQHEADLLVQGRQERDEQRRLEAEMALEDAARLAEVREAELRELAARLDSLIAMVRGVLPEAELAILPEAGLTAGGSGSVLPASDRAHEPPGPEHHEED